MKRAVQPRFLTWLALLAFLLQGLVVQSHVHIASLEATAPSHQSTPTKAPADCPACQLQAATAAILMPYGAAIFLPIGWVETAPPSLQAFAAAAKALQGWQSRAPPRR